MLDPDQRFADIMDTFDGKFEFSADIDRCLDILGDRDACIERITRQKKESMRKVSDALSKVVGGDPITIYRAMIVQDFDEFSKELIVYGETTPFQEEISWGKKIEKKRQGIGTSWSFGLGNNAYGGYGDNTPDIEVMLYGTLSDIDTVDIDRTFRLNFSNNEKEIRLTKGSRINVEKICINEIYSPQYLREDIKKGYCIDINRSALI